MDVNRENFLLCDRCGTVFSLEHNLIRHIRNKSCVKNIERAEKKLGVDLRR
jgi:uncharacterized C2H2 Zn-finger protein